MLVPTAFILVTVVAAFFGYRPVSALGTSMEPTLRNGDALWVRHLDPADVKVGHIVNLADPIGGWIAHRVISVELLPQGNYHVVTRGDANSLVEEWLVKDDERILVVFVRVPVVGYLLEFFGSILGRVLVLGIASIPLMALWMARRRRLARESG